MSILKVKNIDLGIFLNEEKEKKKRNILSLIANHCLKKKNSIHFAAFFIWKKYGDYYVYIVAMKLTVHSKNQNP